MSRGERPLTRLAVARRTTLSRQGRGCTARDASSFSPRHLHSLRRLYDIADQLRGPIGTDRPVHGAAEAGDHQVLRRDHDDILAHRTLGEERIARPATCDEMPGAKAVIAISPEAGAIADERASRRRRRILHPAFGQDALAANHAIVEIEQAEPRPVARRGEHLARSYNRACGIDLQDDVVHAVW